MTVKSINDDGRHVKHVGFKNAFEWECSRKVFDWIGFGAGGKSIGGAPICPILYIRALRNRV